MKNTKKFTMRTIAATLAALSMMSTITMTAGAIQDTTAAPQTDTVVAETTETPAADPAGTGETPAPEENADTTTAEEKPFVRVEANASSECDTSEAATLYTITFDTDGGTPISPISAPAGATVTPPADPTKEGFYFVCWDKGIPETMPEQDLTIKAVWSTSPVDGSGDIVTKTTAVSADEGTDLTAPADYAVADTQLPASIGINEGFEPCLMAAQNANSEDMYKDDPFLEYTKEAGIAMVNESFATMAEVLPGSNILLAPLQVLFNKECGVKDPADIINEKIDRIDGKLDKIEERLFQMEKHADENTEWLGRQIKNVSDMSEVKTAFKDLAPEARNLCRDIAAIEENTEYVNNYEKTLMIAKLGEKQSYTEVSNFVFKIQKHMYGGGYTFTSLYDAAYRLCEGERMVSREAYEDAKAIVEELTLEYVIAVGLMQEVETAQKAVEQYGDKELGQLSPDIKGYYDSYKKHSMKRMSKNYGDAAFALLASANGMKRFESRYNNTDFVHKGACRKHFKFEVRYLDFKVDPETVTYSSDVPLMEIHKRLTKDEIKDLLEYHPDGKSLFTWLKEVGAISGTYIGDDHYLLLDDTLIETIYTHENNSGVFKKNEFREHDFYFKNAVNVSDGTQDSIHISHYEQEKTFNLFGGESDHRYFGEIRHPYTYLVMV